MCSAVVEDAAQRRVRIGSHDVVTGIHDGDVSGGLMDVDFDLHAAQEGEGSYGRVTAPRTLQELLGFAEPRLFEADLLVRF